MAADNKYSTVLLELKTHYQETIAELEAQTSQLKTKITSLDTLIEDPLLGSDILSVLQGEADSLTSMEPASKAAKAVEPKAKSKKTAPKAASKKKPATPKKSAPTAKPSGTVETKAEATPKKAAQKASSSSRKRKPSAPKKAASQKTKAKKTQKKTTSRSSAGIRPMQSPYTKMFKIDAIEKIMQENTDNAVHIDDLILKLYGELSGDELKAERDRMYQTMYKGTQKNRWIKSPEEPMSYLIKASSKNKTETTKKSSKSDKNP